MNAARGHAKAVLFDMDGVLLLTEPLKAEAHATVVRKLGGDVPPSFYQRHIGKPHQAVQDAFLTEAGIRVDSAEYSKLYREAYQDLLSSRLKVTPGVTDLLDTLSRKDFLLGVVTSSSAWMTNYVLPRTSLDRFFRVRVSADDVRRPKPAPDAYLIALDRLRIGPTAAVAFEDSASGLEAAGAAGLPVLALRHSFNLEQDLSRAVAQFDSLCDSSTIVETIESLLIPAPA